MEDLFNFQQRNHSMPDWREAYKILSVSGRPASRRAIDFSRAFWYRLLQDKVVWTCSTPITQAHRCRRCILLPAYDKRRSSARERQNGGAWAEGNGGGNKTERKCVKKSNIFYEILLFVIPYETVVHTILSWKLKRVDWWSFFSKNDIFVQSLKDNGYSFSKEFG